MCVRVGMRALRAIMGLLNCPLERNLHQAVTTLAVWALSTSAVGAALPAGATSWW